MPPYFHPDDITQVELQQFPWTGDDDLPDNENSPFDADNAPTTPGNARLSIL